MRTENIDRSLQGVFPETKWEYWLIRNDADLPIELVRSKPGNNIVIAGEGKGETQHKRSHYFTSGNKPDLEKPVSFELIHTGDASAPSIGRAIDEIEGALWFKQRRSTKRKSYRVEDAQQQVLALLASGSSIREAARLCGVPKSTVADWRAA